MRPDALRFGIVTATVPAGSEHGGTRARVRMLDRDLEPQGEEFPAANLADATAGAVVLVADHGDGEARAVVAIVEGGLVRGGI